MPVSQIPDGHRKARTTIWLAPALKKKIEAAAKKEDRTMSSMLARLVEKGLQRGESVS